MDRGPRVLHGPVRECRRRRAHQSGLCPRRRPARLTTAVRSTRSLAKLDKQLVAQKKRRFDEKTMLVDYFERSRDILLKIREDGGLHAGEDVHKIAEEELPVLKDPGGPHAHRCRAEGLPQAGSAEDSVRGAQDVRDDSRLSHGADRVGAGCAQPDRRRHRRERQPLRHGDDRLSVLPQAGREAAGHGAAAARHRRRRPL